MVKFYGNPEMIWNKKWGKLNSRISIIQARIYKYSQKKNKKILNFLQVKIINNLESKYFSMYHIFLYTKWKKINFFGKKIYFTLIEKMGLIQNLKLGEFSTKKIKMHFNQKITNSRLKTSVIVSLQENIKQNLVLLGIEPEWEARFAPHSYGFRKWCNIHFAIKAIFNILTNFHSNVGTTYILSFNLNKYVEHISHSYILYKLKTIPQITKQIKFWLKGGILKNVLINQEINNSIKFMQTSRNVQNIAPFLINVAFHGIETNFKNWILKSGVFGIDNCKIKNNYSICIVRYLDSLLITHRDLNTIHKINAFLTCWLNLNFKITVPNSISKVNDIKRGFEFLGYRFIKILKNGESKIHVYPTKKSQKRLIWLIGEKCRKFRGISVFNLIDFLRLKTVSWASFFRYVQCSECFKKIDYLLFLIIKGLLFKNNGQKEKKLINKDDTALLQSYIFYGKSFISKSIIYFLSKKYNGNRIGNWTPKLSWTRSLYFINGEWATILYNWKNYWAVLTKKYGGFKGWQQKILQITVKD